MNKIIISVSMAALVIGCSTPETKNPATNESEESLNETNGKEYKGGTEYKPDSLDVYSSILMELDTTPKVVGIGGIFFKSAKGDSINTWYSDNLGMSMTPYGSIFESRNANRPEEVNYLSWGTFPESTTYFAPSESDFMINYRVQNMDGLVRNLRANGVIIVDSIVTYDYGKFVHIMDLDGNKIELWEPIDHVLSEMGGPTNK